MEANGGNPKTQQVQDHRTGPETTEEFILRGLDDSGFGFGVPEGRLLAWPHSF